MLVASLVDNSLGSNQGIGVASFLFFLAFELQTMARPQQSRSRSPRGQASLDFQLTSSRTTRVLTVASSGPMARTTASFFPSGVLSISPPEPQVSIEQIPERAARADPMNRRPAPAQEVGVCYCFPFLLGWDAPEGKLQAPQPGPEHVCRDCGETIPAIFSRLSVHPGFCNQCVHEKLSLAKQRELAETEMENFDAMVHAGLDDEEVNEDGWHDHDGLFGDHFEAPDIGADNADSWDEFSTADPSTSDCCSSSCGCESSTPSAVDDDIANLRDVRSDVDIAAIEVTVVTAGEEQDGMEA